MSTAARTIPVSIRRGLARVDRRVRALGAMKGLGVSACALSAGAILGQAADFLLALPSPVRWGLWASWMILAAALSAFLVVRPLVRKLRVADLAAVAELAHPGMDEQLISTVELLDGRMKAHGSPALIDALALEAEARAKGLDFTRALSSRTAVRWLTAGVIALLILILPPILRPDPFRALASRFFAPWSDVDRVGLLTISVNPGDTVSAMGSDLAIRAEVRSRIGGPLPSSAWLEWKSADGRSFRTHLVPELTGSTSVKTFSHTLRNLSSSLSYQVKCGTASSRVYQVRAVEPPSVSDLSAVIEPPSYTRWPNTTPRDSSRINAFEGSRVTLSMKADRPVKRVEVRWPAPSADGTPSTRSVALRPSEGGLVWSTSLDAQVSGTFTFSLMDADNLRSRPEQPRRLRVVPDQPPALALGGSSEPLDSKADDVLLVDVSTADDVAVASAVLHYEIAHSAQGDSEQIGPTQKAQLPAPLKGLGSSRALGQAALSLPELALKSGDVVRYSVEITDNYPRPRGPHIVRSTERVLRIVDKAEPLLDRQKSADRQGLRDRLETLRRASDTNHQKTVQLRYAADAVLRGNGRWNDDQAEDLSKRHSDALALIDGLESLARDFLDSGRFTALARPTRQVAEVEAEGAREMLEQSRRADDADTRLNNLRQADGRLDAVTRRIDDLIRQFDALARQDEDRRRLRALAERQDALARKSAEMALQNAGTQALDPIRQEQDQLRNQVDDLVRKSPELRAEMLAHRAQEAQRLAERARDLAERQRQQEREAAHPDLRAEALAELAREQQAIENEARRLAMEVDMPLRDNSRSPVNTDALAKPADPLARGAVEEARQQLDQAQNELRRLARDLADVQDDPRALAQRLLKRQDEVRRQASEALRDGKTPEEQADRLRPLADRQEAIARLTAAIPTPEIARDQAEAAVEATNRAAQDFDQGKPNEVKTHQTQARDALNRLVKALPDANQRRQHAQKALTEARNRTNQVARDLERHLRETAPQRNRPSDPVASARDLARRIEPLVQRQQEAVHQLEQIDVRPEDEPQRQRAEHRAQALADTIDALREAAPPESAANRPAERADDWHLLAPFAFDANPMFPVAGPIDLKAPQMDKDKHPITWKGASSGDRGLIDLGSLYPKAGPNVSAFGVSDFDSPASGPGRLVIGSDDSITVWLNGKQVFESKAMRNYEPEQDAVDVPLVQGPNRLVVRCGNGSDQWKFSVSVVKPASTEIANRLARVEQLRRALPPSVTDTQAALDRLQTALQDQAPADDLAAELASEMRDLAQQAANPPATPIPAPQRAEMAEDARRIANALRNLNTPDAPLPRAEAIRLADRVAEAMKPAEDAGAPALADPSQAASEAAHAVEALARRLADDQSPFEQADNLALAQKALNQPDAPVDPQAVAQAQQAVSDDLARIPHPPASPPAVDEARASAQERVDSALALADQAQQPNADPDALHAARADAAHALHLLAQAQAHPGAELAQADPAPAGEGQPEHEEMNNPKGQAPPPGEDQGEAHAPELPANPRDAARALAQQQRALAEEMRALRDAAEHAPEADRPAAMERLPQQMAPLAHREQALARAASQIATPPAAPNQNPTDPQRHQTEAHRTAQRAAEAMGVGDPARAEDQAHHAADALDQLAQTLPEKPPPAPAKVPDDPDLGLDPHHVEAARALAHRERHVQQRLQAMLGQKAAPQEALRDEAADLGQDAAALRDQIQGLSGRAQGPANNAASTLQNHAAPTMSRGAEQLMQGHLNEARNLERQAADHVENAARALSDTAQALRADASPDALANADADPNSGLADAHSAQRQAAQQLAQGQENPSDAAQSASESMHQAAEGLRAVSQPSQSMAPAQPGENPLLDPHGLGQIAQVSASGLDPAHLSKGGRAWGELPGHLRTEILQMSQDQYRADYARLIQLYFREIAADASSDTPQKVQSKK